MIIAMRDIDDKSQSISRVIKVIDDIAFQTNILALNAAVEAARAGEQGRGFAVVAGEVRNLASRSAQAAKEIKLLIDESVSRVKHGSVLVENSGATMQDIVRSVTRVTDIRGEIASASDEQSRGIEQVTQAVTQMDQVTQQNAALVVESASAASALEEQAITLADAVAVFRLADDNFVAPENGASAASSSLKESQDCQTA
jgi:methyl-accepting chemotaxis protein-4 (peptide sensor receptor)